MIEVNCGDFGLNKFNLFVKNFLVYGLGGVIVKVIPLIMVPIVTRLMPSSEYYGLNDLSTTIVSFASALAIMGMYDGMYRMFFEKDETDYKKDITSTTLIFVLISSAIVFFIMLLFKNVIAQLFFKDEKYAYLVYISAIATFVGASNGIISAPTRMENKTKIFLITNTISPIISYTISIPLLLNGHYIIALPIANLISVLVLEIAFGIINRKWFSFNRFNSKYLKQILAIAIPLLPNFLVYWVFNSSDKLMITNIISVGAAGIYSVGAKLGNASQLIYTAFAGGWQYFAFSTMKEKDQVKSNSSVFEYLGVISFAFSMFVFALAKPIYELLFVGEYVEGFIVAPYLFLAPLLQMLFQIAANQFIVVRKTWPNLLILSTGAIINVVINVFLIPVFGIEGAAIATLLGYVISDIICVFVLCKMKLMIISTKFVVASILMLCFILVWRLLIIDIIWVTVFLAVAITSLFIWLYRNDLSLLLKGLKK